MPHLPRLLSAALLAALAAPAGRADEAGGFRAGFAERDITPPIGSEAPGGYGKAYHKTLHDPCKVRAAVFDDGTKRVALVGLDALFVHRDTVEHVRKAIAKKTGLAEGAILLGASHAGTRCCRPPVRRPRRTDSRPARTRSAR